jgi:hypothetical protein
MITSSHGWYPETRVTDGASCALKLPVEFALTEAKQARSHAMRREVAALNRFVDRFLGWKAKVDRRLLGIHPTIQGVTDGG